MLKFKGKYQQLFNKKISFSILRTISQKNVQSTEFETHTNKKDTAEILKEYGYGFGNKLLYNSQVELTKATLGYSSDYYHNLKKKAYVRKLQHILETTPPLPVSLKYYLGEDKVNQNTEVEEEILEEHAIKSNYQTNFPLGITQPIGSDVIVDTKTTYQLLSKASVVDQEIRKKYELLKNTKNWMTAYDNYEDDLETDEATLEDFSVNYGTPDPKSKVSHIPCGGCGALLHCKDPAIPGYIPSEIFKNYKKHGGAALEAITCQRCYFLKEHNVALEVQVSPEDYPKVLMTIKKKKALVLVMVDLTDFPCSIWPGIADILGPHIPIFVVGNKIDLLPRDNKNFLTNVKNNLWDNMKIFGFGSLNILNVSLISAKTGYGVEDLICSIHTHWRNRGDVYLVGCTNVGKSSLFNALLRSDFCKAQAQDLIQRATTSLWPGTTLNLLKFPILNPSYHRIYLRRLRVQEAKKLSREREQLRRDELKKSNSIEHATLMGHIGQTFGKKVMVNEDNDTFSTSHNEFDSGRIQMGINEKHPDYALSKWCYDTPGVVQPDQILNILTADELMYVIPRELIRPETFILKPGMSLFIAGLARLDFIEGATFVRLTVFRSKELPITVSYNECGEKLYEDFLGTDFFKVPINEGNRLSQWPGLELAKTFTVTGIDGKQSSKDIVLSSAGWVAINCLQGTNCKFQAWTPEKRGVYIRDCLLPKAVTLRGEKIRNTVSYKEHKLI